MEAVSKLVSKHQVLSRDIDFTKKIKLSSVFNCFQDIAWMHADNLGIGFNKIAADHNVAWVLTRMKVDIVRLPVWNEEVVFETWPQLPKKYKFERDFLVKDMDGNVIMRAVSVWVIIDIDTRELKKTEVIDTEYPEMITERALEPSFDRLKPFGEPEIVYKKMVGCSDIDVNEHLNNCRYIDFIMDCFSMEGLKKYFPKHIQINYISESLPGDTIVLYRDVDPSNPMKIYIEGIDEKDGKTIFKSLLNIAENPIN